MPKFGVAAATEGASTVAQEVPHEESCSLTIVGMIVGRLNSMRITMGTIGGNAVGIRDIIWDNCGPDRGGDWVSHSAAHPCECCWHKISYNSVPVVLW